MTSAMTVDWSADESTPAPIVPPTVEASSFVKCWAKCLGHSVEDVEKWVAECHKDIKCWIKKVGLDAVVCAGKCIGKVKVGEFLMAREAKRLRVRVLSMTNFGRKIQGGVY